LAHYQDGPRGWFDRVVHTDNSDAAISHRIMEINDDAFTSDDTKIKLLTEKFAEIGVEIIFED
jgi:hypothetical protein